MMIPMSFLQQNKAANSYRPPWPVRIFAWIVGKWKLLLGIVALVFGITQTAGFTAFIIEEKEQQLGFGVFSYQQMKQWEPALDAIKWCIEDGKRDMKLYRILSIFNPITGWAFQDYGEANLRKLGWQMDSIQRRLGEVESRVTVIEDKIESPSSKLLDNAPEIGVKAQPAQALAGKTLMRVPIRPARQIDQETREAVRKQNLVYKTKFGACFHRKSCASIRGKAVSQRTKKEAQIEGLRPCKRCKP